MCQGLCKHIVSISSILVNSQLFVKLQSLRLNSAHKLTMNAMCQKRKRVNTLSVAGETAPGHQACCQTWAWVWLEDQETAVHRNDYSDLPECSLCLKYQVQYLARRQTGGKGVNLTCQILTQQCWVTKLVVHSFLPFLILRYLSPVSQKLSGNRHKISGRKKLYLCICTHQS